MVLNGVVGIFFLPTICNASAGVEISNGQGTKDYYIVRPHTVTAPVHNYTALGRRLRFSVDNPSGNDVLNHAMAVKGQKSSAESEEKKLSNPNNVWERLRSGLKIFWPGSTSAQPKNALMTEQKKPVESALSADSSPASLKSKKNGVQEQLAALKYIIQPHTATPPKHHYTDLGRRLRFGTDNSSNMPSADADQSVKQNNTAKSSDPKKALIDERINRHIRFYSQNPGYLYRVAERARPYLYHIVEQLNLHHLPLELALLPIVESAYQSTAMSPKGAAGLWQFIPGTGKDYDLDQTDQSDERLDVPASTQAAIRYLLDLNDHFKGDWLLALAAYNCGQGAVDSAINRNLSEGMQADYWSLRLPEETQNYVPRFLALSHIFANPENYGLKLAPIKNAPYFIKATMARTEAY